jgi:hypothetical protein
VFCRHPPRRCPAERLPDASGVRAAARRCQWDAQAASGSGPNAVFCRPRPRRRPGERLPDRPSIPHDRLRLSEPGCRRLPATAGRRLASPACRHSGARPGGSGSHPCQAGWWSMSWLAPSVVPPAIPPARLLGVGGDAHRAGVPSVATDPSAASGNVGQVSGPRIVQLTVKRWVGRGVLRHLCSQRWLRPARRAAVVSALRANCRRVANSASIQFSQDE